MPLMKKSVAANHSIACHLKLDFFGFYFFFFFFLRHINTLALARQYPSAEGVTAIKAPTPRSNVSRYPTNTKKQVLFTPIKKVDIFKTQIV